MLLLRTEELWGIVRDKMLEGKLGLGRGRVRSADERRITYRTLIRGMREPHVARE